MTGETAIGERAVPVETCVQRLRDPRRVVGEQVKEPVDVDPFSAGHQLFGKRGDGVKMEVEDLRVAVLQIATRANTGAARRAAWASVPPMTPHRARPEAEAGPRCTAWARLKT